MTDVQDVGRRRSRFGLLVLGALTFWPPLYMLLFIGAAFGTVMLIPSGSSQGEPWIFTFIFPLHFFTMFEMMALTVYYAVNVYCDPDLVGDRKLLWMVIVLLGGFIGQAIFYVMWMIKRHPSVPGSSTAVPLAAPTPQVNAPDAG